MRLGISYSSKISAFSALLSFSSLICNAKSDSNFSCLNRINNFGINSLQKLQNLSQNAISRIVGTLMCKSCKFPTLLNVIMLVVKLIRGPMIEARVD